MISTLYNFADLLKEDEELKVYFSPAENPFEGREDKGKVLNGIIENKKFKGFEVEDFKPSYIPKYLYRRPAGSNGTNTIPTLYINTKEPEKTSKKIKKSIDNYNLTFILGDDLKTAISNFEDFDYNMNYSYIVTFTIDGKYFGDFGDFVSTFNKEAYKKYYQKNYGNTKKETKLCAITNEISTVYGFVDTLGFTVDADSFRRNGFDANNAHSMFPVSEKAISSLEGGRAILINKLAAHFYDNLQYAIIPHFVFQPDHETSQYIARKFLNKAAFNVDSKEDRGAVGFINDTETILDEIIKDGDLVKNEIYYDILFFEQQQAQFKIHLELNDVLPSRINWILMSKKYAEDYYKIYTTYKTKKGVIQEQKITLYRLKEYFSTGEKNTQPAFYRLIQSIFTGQTYDDSKLLKLVVDTWKKSFKKNYHENENTFNFLIKNTLGNLYFLNLLEIFKNKHTMSKQTMTEEKQDAFSFIDAHPAYFDKEYLKGAFIFGCLVARLLYNQPGNAFMKELNGLNIDKDIIIKKFPKLISKLLQFKKNFPEMELMESAAMRFFAHDEKVGKDEISFVFTMGLVLQKDFDRINKKNKPQKPDNDE